MLAVAVSSYSRGLPQPPTKMALRPGESVAKDLDAVPVFGILLSEENCLYCVEGKCMVYTQLADALKVLARMQDTYPGTELDVMPLALGNILLEAGMLTQGSSSRAPSVEVELVASPAELRFARNIREQAAAPPLAKRTGAGAQLQRVPIFHIGAISGAEQGEGGDKPTVAEETPLVWPFFFRAADVDELWQQQGGGAPRPEMHATDLAALIDGLRDVDSAPAPPLICAPLDALAYLRERDIAVAAEVTEAMSKEPRQSR